MPVRKARLAALIAVGVMLLPPAAAAADPGSSAMPSSATEWRGHLEHMRSMHGSVGAAVNACLVAHDSMAGQFGPHGEMMR